MCKLLLDYIWCAVPFGQWDNIPAFYARFTVKTVFPVSQITHPSPSKFPTKPRNNTVGDEEFPEHISY